jgi:flagellar hook-associated protein 3 FlgL
VKKEDIIMRVATKMIYSSVRYNLGNIAEALSKANNVVSTGKRIAELSDDPVDLVQALDIKSTLSNIEQLERNIDLGESWLNSAESALDSVQDLISDAKALCIQMASATTGESERASAATTIQNTLDEIVSLANTEVNGRYIFAGSNTDSIPFNEYGSYNGDNSPFTIKIGRNATLAVGSDGEAVFEGIFQTLSDLKDALEGNDVNGIEEAMDNLDDHFDQITAKISDIGSKLNRTEIKKGILSDLNLSNTDRLSEIEYADITEAIIELEEIGLIYQAALSSSTKVMGLSLVDYID